MQTHSNFAELKFCNNIWAIGSIHSHLDSFESVKKYILKNYSKNDRIVFLGNIIGLGDSAKETLSSVIDLRNQLMSKFFLKSEDNIHEFVNSDLLPNFDVKYDIHQFENAIDERLRKGRKDEV